MKKLLALSVCAALAACTAEKTEKLLQLDASLPVAETVNGTPVPQTLLDSLARARNIDLDKPDQRAKALISLADLVLLAEQARRDQITSKPANAADVEYARLMALAGMTMSALEQQTPLTDEALKAEYDGQVARAGKFTYDFSSLLFAKVEDAQKAADEVHAGKPFAQVYDEWKASAQQAKVMTDIHADQMPEELAKAVAGLKPGETLAAPVKTQFGWHLVNLTGANAYVPPPFDRVKDGIRAAMGKKLALQRLEKLREQAKIEYPAGVAPPAPHAAPTSPAGKSN